MERNRGFTLIELLVVIAIILLLVGILLPTFQGIEALKMNMHCQKNLQEIGKAFSAYAMMNDGWYPYPVDYYYGSKYIGDYVPADRWGGLPQIQQLKQAGASARIFVCPFDPSYGEDSWPWNTWRTPFHPSYRPESVYVYVGYSILTYRGYGGGHTQTFADGRYTISNDGGDDDIPIVSDRLFVRTSMTIKGGWYHGGGVPDGLLNADCNTLFKGGFVVHTDAAEFDWNKPSIVVGSCKDLWWFALSR